MAGPASSAAAGERVWRSLPRGARQALEDQRPEVIGLDLSLVAHSALAAASHRLTRNRVVSTVRSSEVVSDPTDVLAIEASTRRRRSRSPVHLAACHRVLRGQRYDAPGTSQHLKLFALVSTDRDSGSARTEAHHACAWWD